MHGSADWFVVEIPLGETRSATCTLRPAAEVARLTGRSYRAVLRAVADGRLRRAVAPEGARRGSVWVEVGAEDLVCWRVGGLEETLAAHPSVPQEAHGWRTLDEVAASLGVPKERAYGFLRRHGIPRVESNAGPFRGFAWYWLPEAAVLTATRLEAPCASGVAR